jgi:hypothetical protein
MDKDKALDLALEALEYIENNYMSLPKSGSEAITAIKQARSAPVQVSPLEFVTMVMEKEHLVGKPLFWAEWPNKENT